MAKQNARELAILGLFTAILFLGQVFLAVLPNIEVVSLLIILYTSHAAERFFWSYTPLCCWKASATALGYGGSAISTSGAYWRCWHIFSEKTALSFSGASFRGSSVWLSAPSAPCLILLPAVSALPLLIGHQVCSLT